MSGIDIQPDSGMRRQPAADRGYEPLQNIERTGAPALPEKFIHLPKGCYSIPQQDSLPWHMCVSEDQKYSVLHHFHAADEEAKVCEDAECANLKQRKSTRSRTVNHQNLNEGKIVEINSRKKVN